MGYAPDPISGKGKRQTEKPQSFSYERDASKCKSRLLVLTPIAKPMNRFAVCSDPRAERPKDRKDDQGRNDRVVQIGPGGLASACYGPPARSRTSLGLPKVVLIRCCWLP